jgi:UDP-N-acetylmuramoyl-L-alanyl-D-glutamate--2,6-diaminopimelate ligase
MAQAVEKFADHIYVTSDNPRSEDPNAIIEEILAGFADPPKKPLVVEPDRRSAIRTMLDDAEAGDVLVLAGKGHESYQIIGQTKHHFDDVEEVESILRRSTGFAA